ncbi:Up-regulated during septation-domain-containing protein [Crepidotus variabilis]|uniref:Up-regulated during septation-domain-containing protein n=1 Tax=Crepidotus variabilis TaxID=179855 RepID=A0A9P6ERK9_9AGAR|nr:Up-regulated during septation-domain-containing protein [Crepidotus variabilis]
MNGVRRLLGAATSSSPQQQPDSLPSSPAAKPLSFGPRASGSRTLASASPYSSPQASSGLSLTDASPKASTTSSFINKKERKQPATNGVDNELQSPFSTPSRTALNISSRSQPDYPPSSPTRAQTMPSSPASVSSSRYSTRKSVNTDPGWKRLSGNLNTRDELLMSLIASEAVIDSREFDILSAEEVEELKKEHQVLSSRLGAMNKKLALETKIRDAALNLSKVNSTHKKMSKQTSEQLDAANRRVELAQRELWKVSDRVNDVYKRLMEHRAGVLSMSVRNMEKKLAGAHEDSGYDSSNRSTLMSPTLSVTALSPSSRARFDGAHLFAGHADAVVPKPKLSAEAAAAELAKVEEKLKEAKDQLLAATKKQGEMTRELSMMRLEKQEVETMMGMDLQAAEETIAALEQELPRLEDLNTEVHQLRDDKSSWTREKAELLERSKQVDVLQARLLDMENQRGAADGAEKMLEEIRNSSRQAVEEKDRELQLLKESWQVAQEEWEREKALIEEEKLEDLSKLQEEMDKIRDEEQRGAMETNEELNAGLATLQFLIKKHGIVLFSRDSSLQGLLNAIGMHIETVHAKLDAHTKAEGEWDSTRRKLEDDIRTGFDKRESLARRLEEARNDRDVARRDTMSMESRLPGHLRTPSVPVSTLPPLSALPPAEVGDLDVARIVAILQPLWHILPSPEARAAKAAGNSTRTPYRTDSPTSGTPSTPGGSNNAASLSDVDVRTLKTLYDPRSQASPQISNGPFTIEGFARRVQALINDDRALIERLVRFAQAHDLLKRNAERAQKLAQGGNNAMETYQKQVRILEERNFSIGSKAAALQEEVQILHDTIERLTADKHELEKLAADQAETCQQLTEANNTLSARTLTLAEEAAQAPEMIKKLLESQLAECKKSLESAQDELDAMRSSEQSQRIALLDELNSMQTENGNLRAQLRALKK